MRLVFMGTPDFAVAALDALVAAGHSLAAVYTQPPRPANRGRLTASPVHRRAEALGLPVRTPLSLSDEAERSAFAALHADCAIVAAYGLILPQAVLDAPTHGCLNIHASLLPRWRGAAPVQRAILAGDEETGVTIMRMERGLDTGPMLASERIAVGDHTAGSLADALAAMGARMMIATLAHFPGLAELPQPAEGVTYAHKIDKSEARIDWQSDARQIARLVRAMQPSPGAWFEASGQRIKLIAAQAVDGAGLHGHLLPDGRVGCGTGCLRLITVQPEGKGKMPAEDWLRGLRLGQDARLT